MKAFCCGLIILGAVGCTQLQPIGPLAGAMKSRAPAEPAAKEKPETMPQVIPAPRPVAPAELILPDDVSPENVNLSRQRLQNELEYDTKTIPAPGKTEGSDSRDVNR